jgi:transcription initiation factor IIE alpha subunit
VLKSIVDRLEVGFGTYPLVKDGFTSEDYAAEVGIGSSTARERLRKLASEGVVRKVRIKRTNGIREGWQILPEKKGRARG